MMSSSRIKKEFERTYMDLSLQIFRHCYFRISDRERAKEIAQDVFMRTWDYICLGNNIDNMKAFVYKVANNLLINELERRKRHSSLDAMNEDVNFEPPSDIDESTIEQEAEAKMMFGKLAQLDPDHKELILLRYVDGLSIKEIAEATGEDENNISVKLHRIIKKLKELYE